MAERPKNDNQPDHETDTVRLPGRGALIRAAFLSALALTAGIAVLAYYVMRGNAERTHWVDHTYETILATDSLRMDHQAAGASARGYLLTGEPLFIEPYRKASAALQADLDKLANLVQDNPAQSKRVEDLRQLSAIRLATFDGMLAQKRTAAAIPVPRLTAQLLQSTRSMDDVNALTDAVTDEENRLLTERREQAAHGGQLTLWVIAVGDLTSLTVLLVCFGLLLSENRSRRRAEARARLLNATLSEHNALLESSNRELEGFSYTISHDLRSPLRAIDGFSELLERRYGGKLDPEALRLLAVVRDNSRRMAVLIDDLLEFSRLGRRALQMEEVDMQALAQGCVAEVLQTVQTRPAVEMGLLPPCRGDRSLLRQTWVNLVGNAVKYSSRNPAARVEIAGRSGDGENIYSVRDNGVGFDMQYYDKLFGVFQRLHAEEDFPGTGVGLAITMRIVTKHGGRLWADAVPGRGAVFHFSLPGQEGGR
jgi:signal transduction histidine kinase